MKDWLFRIQFDVDAAVNSFFVTLTYNEDNLPDKVSLADVQKFFKRLRKRCEPKKIGGHLNSRYVPLSYFLCSEYGALRNRPHYHAIIMNVVPLVGTPQENIESAWSNGFVYIGSVTSASCRYVLKYIQKDSELPVDKLKSLFYVMSKGIGKSFLTISNGHNKINLGSRHSTTININGFEHVMPRYFQTKIYGENRRAVFDESRRLFENNSGIASMSEVQFEEYKSEERDIALSRIDNIQRRRRLSLMGVRSVGKI